VHPLQIAAAWIVFGTTLTFAQATQAPAPKTLPKGAVAQSTRVTAAVTQLDQKTRMITLKSADGQEYTFAVDPAVKNLPQVNVGDTVVATYTEALAYEVKKGGTAGASGVAAGGTAEPGKMPAGAIGRRITITVSIAAIDPAVPSVTFKGPQGNTRTVKVRDPKKLEGVSVGDTVDITYTEALALKIDKAPVK
jgi:hypothetical protein